MGFLLKIAPKRQAFSEFQSFLYDLIPKKAGVESIKELRPIRLIRSIHKSLAKVLDSRIQKAFPSMISQAQGAFVHSRQILDK